MDIPAVETKFMKARKAFTLIEVVAKVPRALTARGYIALISVTVLSLAPFGLTIPPVKAAGQPTSVAVTGESWRSENVHALIVAYKPGKVPNGATVLGASKVTGVQRTNLKLSSPLGERMWKVEFVTPVSVKTAERVARQLSSHPAVTFAEIDQWVTTRAK